MGSYPQGMDTITLNGVEYGVDVLPGEVNYVKSPQPQFVDEDRQVFWTDWTLRSFHNGERMPYILTEEDLEAFQYHNGEGIDVNNLSEWGEVKVQPALSRSLAVQSATMPMIVTADGVTLLVGLTASPWVKIWTSAAGWVNASTVAGTGAVVDMLVVGTTLYLVRGGHLYTSTDAGDTWAEAAAPTFTTAVGVAYANGDVYVLSSGSGVHNHTQNTAVSTIKGTVIAGYRENIYWGADSRLYLYNGRSVTLYDSLPAGFNMTALIPYRSLLLILGYYKVRSGYRGAVYYLVQGTENHLYSLGDSTADHRIYAAAGSDDEIWFASPERGGADRYDMTRGGISSGPATGTAMYIPFKSMAVCEGYLWVGRYDNTAGTDGVYQADVSAPTSYATSGWLTTATYDFRYPNVQKLFRDIRVEHLALTTGQSIAVSYSLDNGTTWTAALTSSTVGDTSKSATLSNIKGNNIKLKITLTSGGSQTTTPTLLKTVVRAAPVTEAKYQWQIRLPVYPNLNGKALMSAISTAYAAQAQLAFIDVEDSTFNVIIQDASVVRKPSKNNNYGFIMVTLREV